MEGDSTGAHQWEIGRLEERARAAEAREMARFEGAVTRATGMLGSWSLFSMMAGVPTVFVTVMWRGGAEGAVNLLPVVGFWGMGFGAAAWHAWEARWSRFPRMGRPLTDALKEIGGLVWRGVAFALLLLVAGAVLGGGYSWR